MSGASKYCLDANVLIQAWQKYYSPKICPSYWEVLNELGSNNRIFIPKLVFEEITRTEDELTEWLKTSNIKAHEIDESVTQSLKKIYDVDPNHKFLVSNNGLHSVADPWVIAHAMTTNATVVTKEIKDVFNKPTKIKIPHVCDKMGVKWIDDFKFIEELNIKFSCKLK